MNKSELIEALADSTAREEALLSRLSLLECAYMELEKELAGARKDGTRTTALRPRSSQRRFSRPAGRLSRSPAVEEEPVDDAPGLVLVAARLAREGHTRGEVASFLQENFCVTDLEAVVEKAFADLDDREPAGA